MYDEEFKNMSDDQNEKYIHYTKVAWAIYASAVIVVVALLVLFVAQDNEERIFYSLMTVAAAYVLRPGERLMARKILKYTGVAKPTEEAKPAEEE